MSAPSGGELGLAFILGAIAGSIEVASRHRTYRFGAASTRAGAFLVLISGLLGAAFLWLYDAVGATFLPTAVAQRATPEVQRAFSLVAAATTPWGLARIGIARHDREGSAIAASMLPFVQPLVNLLHEAIGRELGERTARAMTVIMNGVSFARARDALPRTCINLTPSVTQTEVRRCADRIKALNRLEMDDATRAFNLGVIVAEYYGVSLVHQVVTSLGASIRDEGA